MILKKQKSGLKKWKNCLQFSQIDDTTWQLLFKVYILTRGIIAFHIMAQYLNLWRSSLLDTLTDKLKLLSAQLFGNCLYVNQSCSAFLSTRPCGQLLSLRSTNSMQILKIWFEKYSSEWTNSLHSVSQVCVYGIIFFVPNTNFFANDFCIATHFLCTKCLHHLEDSVKINVFNKKHLTTKYTKYTISEQQKPEKQRAHIV